MGERGEGRREGKPIKENSMNYRVLRLFFCECEKGNILGNSPQHTAQGESFLLLFHTDLHLLKCGSRISFGKS
jgi:hypothetical protein